MSPKTFVRSSFGRGLAVLLVLLALSMGYAHTQASPQSGGTIYRADAINSQGVVYHSTLLTLQAQTNPGANTPVTGPTFCIQGDPSKFAADMTLTGTLAGTNPTLNVKIVYSTDNGATFQDMIVLGAVNATVTPAVQHGSASDVAATTPVVIGNCFRYVYTYGGTSAGGTFGLKFMAK